MWEFVQSYGFWIVFALLFFLMMRAHGHGGQMHRGCGMDELRKRALPGEEGQSTEASEAINGEEQSESRTAQL